MALDESEQRTVDKMTVKLNAALAEARRWKANINGVYEVAGESLPYSLDDDTSTTLSTGPMRRQYGRAEFFGKLLSPVVRQILTDHGPLDEHELYDKMIEGGYKFEVSDPDKAKTGLKISLGKLEAFGRTPNGHYTLAVGTKRAKKGGVDNKKPSGSEDGEQADPAQGDHQDAATGEAHA